MNEPAVKRCRRGHLQIPDNLVFFPSCPKGRCRWCMEDAIMFWREDNREHINAYVRERNRKKRKEMNDGKG